MNLSKLMDCCSPWGRTWLNDWKTYVSTVNLFFFFYLAAWHMRSLFPSQGLNLCPLHWKCGVLTTELPGKSQHLLTNFFGLLPLSPNQFSPSVMSDFLWPHRLQHARFPCPSLVPGACSNSCPSIQWCHPTSSSSVVSFSSCLQSFPASGSLPISQFSSGGQSIRASASVLPTNIQNCFPLGLTGLISLQSKGLSRVWTL